jgi:peptidoglycan/xylan/chitin deacetylase (PgdA/CDA1 family)
VKEGGFRYDCDSYADDLPYWNTDYGKPHLVIPYTLSENDMCFVRPANFPTGQLFGDYLKDNLRYAVKEGRKGHPTMMSVGLHCRLSRPGRVAGLEDFLNYAKSLGDEVWFCTREQIADHWYKHHYPG